MKSLALAAVLTAIIGPATQVKTPPKPADKPVPQKSPGFELPVELEAQKVPSTHTGGSVLIRNGRLETVTHGVLEGSDLLILKGKIVQIGKGLTAPAGVSVVDATGRIVTPGLVDSHSHRGEDESNEWTDSITSEVRIRDVLNPSQLGLYYNLAGGITTCLVLHGSANPIGGQSIVIKSKWMRPVEELPFPGAPRMIKFALGENVTGKNDPQSTRYPKTRLGVETVYRRAFADARDYSKRWKEYAAHSQDPKVAPPRRDLRLEALADVLDGKVWVQCHSYRQDEMLMMARLSEEYGFHLVLQHALESYKIAPELAAAHIPVSMFGDAFTYKVEVLDSIPQAVAIADQAGVLTAVNTDTFSGTTSLTQDAGKAVRYGVTPARALRMLTINPATEIGVADHVGSLDVGKDGDIAIWQGDPLSVYSKCQMTLIDGEVVFQRRDAFRVDAASAASTGLQAKSYSGAEYQMPRASRSYLLRGATVHTESGMEVATGSVLIQDGKVAKVSKEISTPSGTTIIDAKGLHVYPGFIDGGAQIGLNEVGSTPIYMDQDENGDFHPDLRALTAVNPDTSHVPKARMNGITSAVIAPGQGLIAGQGTLIRLAGNTTEEMGILPKTYLVVNMPAKVSGEELLFLPPADIAKRNSQIAEKVRQIREYFEAGKRYVAAKDAGEEIATDIKLEALRPYLSGSLPVLFRAPQANQIRQALAIAKDLGLRPILGVGREAWKVRALLAERKVPVILDTPATSCPDSSEPDDQLDPYDSPYAVAALLHQAGVKFCFESSATDNAKNLPYGVGRMCAFGLSKEAALRALTVDAAEILGVGDRLGTLQPGKVANLIVTDGDPLEVTTNMKYVFIDGQPVRLDSHFTELYRKYAARAKVNGNIR